MDSSSLSVKIFADSADITVMRKLYKNSLIKGFTTNPTLMRKAGVQNYRAFALDLLKIIPDRPISFEVFSDDFDGMIVQGMELAKWGRNVYVKIPITNTKGEFTGPVIDRLSQEGVRVNVTAVLTLEQVSAAMLCLTSPTPSCISVFAGRVADTGVDPLPLMKSAIELTRRYSHIELIWASPRELFNVVQACEIGCHIITVTEDILRKLHLLGKDLRSYSLDTVRMFYDDAVRAGYTLVPGTEV
jgi:transaldolase